MTRAAAAIGLVPALACAPALADAPAWQPPPLEPRRSLATMTAGPCVQQPVGDDHVAIQQQANRRLDTLGRADSAEIAPGLNRGKFINRLSPRHLRRVSLRQIAAEPNLTLVAAWVRYVKKKVLKPPGVTRTPRLGRSSSHLMNGFAPGWSPSTKVFVSFGKVLTLKKNQQMVSQNGLHGIAPSPSPHCRTASRALKGRSLYHSVPLGIIA